MILTKEEREFVAYWEANRLRKKKVFNQLALGLPLAVLLVIAIFVNFFSSWYKRAEMARNEAVMQSQSSLILVLIVAAILIVAFVVIFSVKHKWDINEQRYRELVSRK